MSQFTSSSRLAHWALLGLAAAALVVVAAIRPAGLTEWEPQRPEFMALAWQLERSGNEIVGHAVVEALRRRLASPAVTGAARIQEQVTLAKELTRLGRPDEAASLVEEALAAVNADPSMKWLLADVHRMRGLVSLRQAELANCIARHNAECCVFPLAGGGIHVEKGPATRALESYLFCLDASPNDLKLRWLANIAAMALGEHPQAVPERFVIPESAFESEQDIGRFTDIAGRLGLATLNLAGGAIVEDFDNDGFLDIVSSTFDPRGSVVYFRNRGDGTFEDRSDASRLSDQFGGLNCVAADYDNDGLVDVLVLRGAWLYDDGRIRCSLLRNNGDGTFTDVTREAGIAEPTAPTQAAAWGDIDNDGLLDLYIGCESRVEVETDGTSYPSKLYRNNGDGTFTDVAAKVGVTNDRYAKGVAFGDYDGDGRLDLYVSNIGKNRLYRQNPDGTFTDVAERLGVTGPEGRSFACWFFDYNNDGRLDLFVAAYDAKVEDIAADHLGRSHRSSMPRLYRNNGDGTFTDVAGSMDLHRAYLPMGANFGDLDNDGWLDIFFGTGDPEYESLVPNIVLRNDAGRRFVDVTTSGGFGHLQKGHGVAFADLDNDGDQDIFHQLGGFYPGDRFANALYENPGHGNAFLTLRLVGVQTNRFGLGARIRVRILTPGEPRDLHRFVGSVSSFGGSPFRQEIGLGDASAIEEVEVRWPTSGRRQVFTNVPLNSAWSVIEGEDVLLPMRFERVNLSR
jgi:hypothetical protein